MIISCWCSFMFEFVLIAFAFAAQLIRRAPVEQRSSSNQNLHYSLFQADQCGYNSSESRRQRFEEIQQTQQALERKHVQTERHCYRRC